MMRIISLLPVKNEAWVLRHTLSQLLKVSDHVLILDDGSTDETRSLIEGDPRITVLNFESNERHVNMSERRRILLDEGRNAGGTHFVFLDADESFSSQAIEKLPSLLSKMEKGQKLAFPWINVWKDNGLFFYSQKDLKNYKDFVFCDDGISTFENQFLSEGRTPGSNTPKNFIKVDANCGSVLHFQKIASARNQLKQAWYRCNELIEGSRSARRINATYEHTRNDSSKNKQALGDLENNGLELLKDPGGGEYLAEMQRIFKTYGVSYFEGLDIWHIPELRDAFKIEKRREPRPALFPRWILTLNNIKNKIKMVYYSLLHKIKHD